MHLRTGTRYRATLRLGFFEGVAGNGTIQAKLQDAGFTDVTVSGSGRDRTAEGTWGGATQNADLPDQVRTVVEIG